MTHPPADAPPPSQPPPPEPTPGDPRRPPPKVLRTEDLFGDGREVVIEHAGAYYRLRITRRGKLILQK